MVAFLLLVASVAFGRFSYEGVQVLSCQLTPQLRESFYTVIEDKNLIDVWGISANGTADIMVRDAREKAIVLDFFASSSCTVGVENLEDNMRLFDELQANASLSDDWFNSYHTLQDNYNWWIEEQAKYPTVTSVAYLSTQTYEKRPFQLFKINVGNTVKPWIYIQCQIHAREWISEPTCQYVIDQLLSRYTQFEDERRILSTFNFAIFTITNPDGFVYSWTNDRQWRKNRRVNTGSSCVGVDLNRNYDVKWGGGGSSTNPCSDTYMGPSVASEAEVQATVNVIQKDLQVDSYVIAGIDMHSYSQLILRPYGFSTDNSPNEAQMAKLGSAWADGIRATHGRVYTSQKSIDLYVTTGTASDWFYVGAATTNGRENNLIRHPAGFTCELRPTGQIPGFQLPPAEIVPTGQENYAGMKLFFNWFIDNGPLLAST